MANMGSVGILKHIDNPATAIVADAAVNTVAWAANTAGSATNFVRAVSAGKGLHYYGLMDAASGSSSEFASSYKWFTVKEGHCAVEIMVQFTDITHAFTFGFNDTVADGNLLIDISGTGLTKQTTDFCGFVYDGTTATNKDVHCVWVDADTISTSDANGSIDGKAIRMSGMHPTADKWFYMKVEMQDQGANKDARATFLAVDHLGRSVEKVFNTTVLRTIQFCYHFVTENKSNDANSIYLKGCNWEQTIPNM